VVANITSGQLVSRLGAYKGLLLGSLVVLVASFALLALTVTTHESQLGISLKMVLLGVGLGPSIPLFTLAIQTSVPPQQIGVATAAATFFRQMGTTIGLAILGTIFATSFAGELRRTAPSRDELPPEMQAQMQHSGGGEDARGTFSAAAAKANADASIDKAPLPEPAKAAARERAHKAIDAIDHSFKHSLTSALVNVFWISLVIAAIGLLVTAFLPQLALRRGPPTGPPAVD
jgi:hypothetical protein